VACLTDHREVLIPGVLPYLVLAPRRLRGNGGPLAPKHLLQMVRINATHHNLLVAQLVVFWRPILLLLWCGVTCVQVHILLERDEVAGDGGRLAPAEPHKQTLRDGES
jgi:hypothetical protein